MGTTAQTTPLVGGIAEVTGVKWSVTALISSGIGAEFNLITDPNASPASLAVAGAGGAAGGMVKLGLNAALGLANQWIPTTVGVKLFRTHQ